MKALILICICVLIGWEAAFGQCENGTNTNPDPLYVSPTAAGPRTNTFNWMQRPMPVHKPDYTQFQPTGSYEFTSPFYSTSQHLEGIAAGANSDFKPEDGWELVKQDFGYLYKATNPSNPDVGTWNGQENDGSNFTGKPLAYFMLYNKYSTTLRILASTPIQGQISEDRIRVSLNLVAPDAYQYYNGKANLADLKTNGIFANSTPVSSPLDQKTSNLELSAFAVFPSTKSEFFYADFLLGYDPCICFFKSAINVSFFTELTAQISLSGQLVGINRSIADVDEGIEGSEFNNFKSSFFFDEDGNPKGIRQTYESIQDLKSEFNTNPAAKDAAEVMDKFLKGAVVAGSLNIGPEGLKEFKEKGFEKIAPFVEFFSAMAKDGETGPTVLTANMEISGKLESKTERAGYDFRFAIPGSLGATNCDEYNKQNSALGTKPYFPMYNEVPGIFALLETPTLQYKFGGFSSQTPQYACGSGGSQLCNHTLDITSYYKLQDEPIKYALNSLVDVNKTRIEAAIEIIDVPNDLGYSNYKELVNLNYSSNTEEMFYVIDNGNSGPIANDNFPKGTYRKLRTEFYPVDCIKDLVGKSKLDFEGLTQTWQHKHIMQKAFLVVNVFATFIKDVYGKDHFTFQSYKYPLKWIKVTDNLADGDGLTRFNIPNYVEKQNINLPQLRVPQLSKIRTTLSNGSAIDAWYGIHFPGSPPPDLSSTSFIRSGGEIVVEPEYEIDPGFTLEVVDIDNFVCSGQTALSPVMGLDLQAYCNQGQYKANAANSRLTASNSFILPSDVSRTTLSYPIPNPTSGQSTLSVTVAESSGWSLVLHNALGEKVKDVAAKDMATAGTYNLTIETADLEAGVYYLTFTSEGFRQARKLVVVK